MVELDSFNELLSYAFKDVLYGVLLGLKDSCLGIVNVVSYFIPWIENTQQVLQDSSSSGLHKKSRSRRNTSRNKPGINVSVGVIQCSCFNVIIFFFTLILFTFCVWMYKIFGGDLNSHDEFSWVSLVISSAVNIFWILPLFFMSKIINLFWLQDLASAAYRQHHGRTPVFSISLLGSQISDLTFSFLIECLFLGQSIVMQFVPFPWISLAFTVVHYSLLNSLYSFEYLWCYQGWNISKKISYIEANWPYFVGFGLPLTIVSLLFHSYFYSVLLFATFYPFFIIGAIHAPPITVEQRGPNMKVFCIVMRLTSFLGNVIGKSVNKWKSR